MHYFYVFKVKDVVVWKHYIYNYNEYKTVNLVTFVTYKRLR